MTTPSYKFKFQIVDEASGEIVEADWCSLVGSADEAAVGIHVSQMLRNWMNFAREEYERENYQVPA